LLYRLRSGNPKRERFVTLKNAEIVDILCKLVLAYNDMHEVLNFLVEQILRGRMEGMEITEELKTTLAKSRRMRREVEDSLSEFWHKAHEYVYPEKQDGY